jgi:hypothetical protein
MIARDNGNGDFKQPEVGSVAARCYKLIDLGTQDDSYMGKDVKHRQIIIGWEIDQSMEDGQPFTVSAFYTLSLNEKAKLRGILENWRGQPLTEKEIECGFDMKKLLGAPCLLSLMAKENGKIKVTAVTKLPKGMKVPEKHNEPICFDLDHFSDEVFQSLGEWTQKKIAASPEYQKAVSPAGVAPETQSGSVPEVKADNIPF